MMHQVRFVETIRGFLPSAAAIAALLLAAGAANANPLVLRAQGSFFVGGQTIHTDAVSGDAAGPAGGLAGTGNSDDISVNQMYVQYEEPEGTGNHVPVVMLHGCCLSGKTWETTPDGRMGWKEYFVRKHYPVYIPDQVSRARSGFDATTINKVRLGELPASALPDIFTLGHHAAWLVFRFGPAFGTPFSNEQFPIAAADEFGKQVIPDLNAMLPAANPTYANLSGLAIRLKGAVLMGHSESGFFPEQAALVNPTDIRGMISIEGQCPTDLTSEQIDTLAAIPTLVVFGDHLSDVPATAPLWDAIFAGCQQFVQQVKDAGGDITMLHLPDVGIYGNSHMLMQDKNNLQVADLLIKWIRRHVEDLPRGHGQLHTRH